MKLKTFIFGTWDGANIDKTINDFCRDKKIISVNHLSPSATKYVVSVWYEDQEV